MENKIFASLPKFLLSSYSSYPLTSNPNGSVSESQVDDSVVCEPSDLSVPPAKPTKRKHSIGVFDGNLKSIQIIKHKGSVLNQCGVYEQGYLRLSVMEALFLIERGSLVVYKKGNLKEEMSVKDMYAEMFGLSRLENYVVYGYLKRLGYTVYECPYEISSTRTSNWPIFKWFFTISNYSAGLKSILSLGFCWLNSIKNHFKKFLFQRPQHLLPSSKLHLTDSEVYSKIAIIAELPIQNDMKRTPNFVVYPPSTSFSRKNRPDPLFFLHVCPSHERVLPVLEGLRSVMKDIPHVVCIAEGADICFFNVSETNFNIQSSSLK